MKRTKHIDLSKMKKKSALAASAAVVVAGCSPHVNIDTPSDCLNFTNLSTNQCARLFDNKATVTYKNRQDCEDIYGDDACDSRSGAFVPIIGGYGGSRYGGNRDRYSSRTSTINRSDGNANKPASTVSRGGFGSQSSAKSSWGSSSRSRSWGG